MRQPHGLHFATHSADAVLIYRMDATPTIYFKSEEVAVPIHRAVSIQINTVYANSEPWGT